MARNLRRAYPRLYKTYREVGLGQGGVTLTKREVRAAAELAGFSPGEAKQMMQIAQGESGLHPGIRGDDPGGTKGWGLVQNTPGVWGAAGLAYLRKLGGEKALRNPIKNMKMAKFLYDSAGKSFSPWYGTRYLDRNLDRSKVDSVLGKRGQQDGGSTRGHYSSKTVTTPGISRAPDREALKMQVLTTALAQGRQPSQQELLGLAGGLSELEDTPAEHDLQLKYHGAKRGKRARKGGKPGKHVGKGGIEEVFYDPLGKYWDSGAVQQGGIGGHSDHVHVSASTPRRAIQLGKMAQRMGLTVREQPFFDPVDPVHTSGSYHYSNRAIDVSGDAATMRKFAKAAMRRAQ